MRWLVLLGALLFFLGCLEDPLIVERRCFNTLNETVDGFADTLERSVNSRQPLSIAFTKPDCLSHDLNVSFQVLTSNQACSEACQTTLLPCFKVGYSIPYYQYIRCLSVPSGSLFYEDRLCDSPRTDAQPLLDSWSFSTDPHLEPGTYFFDPRESNTNNPPATCFYHSMEAGKGLP